MRCARERIKGRGDIAIIGGYFREAAHQLGFPTGKERKFKHYRNKSQVSVGRTGQ